MADPSLLYDEMGGMENLRYFARLYGIQDDERCAATITAVGLDPGLTRPVRHYSQGMRQRLSLARAMIHNPTILLLDESFSNVDNRSSPPMTHLLTQLQIADIRIFVVTHQSSHH